MPKASSFPNFEKETELWQWKEGHSQVRWVLPCTVQALMQWDICFKYDDGYSISLSIRSLYAVEDDKSRRRKKKSSSHRKPKLKKASKTDRIRTDARDMRERIKPQKAAKSSGLAHVYFKKSTTERTMSNASESAPLLSTEGAQKARIVEKKNALNHRLQW